jgi:acyl-CoA synthetase (AMP-forming)/AMP-acid ligase II
MSDVGKMPTDHLRDQLVSQASADRSWLARAVSLSAARVAVSEYGRLSGNACTGRTVCEAFRNNAMSKGEKIFLRWFKGDNTEIRTFAEVYNEARRVRIAVLAVAKKGVCLIFLPQTIEQYGVFFGVMEAGLIPSFMPCPSPKQHKDIYWQSHVALFERVGPAMIITDRAHARQMEDNGLTGSGLPVLTTEDIRLTDTAGSEDPVSSPNDVAFLQHSSGTTGLKKGVALTHRSVLAQILSYSEVLHIEPDDSIASWLPLYHDMGLIACAMVPAVLGLTVTFLDPFLWTMRPHILLEAITQFKSSFVWMPNFAFEHMSRSIDVDGSQFDLTSVKAFINCSEPCKPETFERFLTNFGRFGLTATQLQVCYAMAETVFAVTQTTPGKPATVIPFDGERLRGDNRAVVIDGGHLLLSAGTPIPGLHVTIRRDGQTQPDGNVGEICVSGHCLFDEYYKLPDVTRERLHDGTYCTRDMGFLYDGELFVLGRNDDLLIIHGKNVYAHEIEMVLSGIEGLKPGRNVAFAVYNPSVGSEEMILLAESGGVVADESLIRRRVCEHVFDVTGIAVAEFRIFEPGWLIKTTSGKISREANRRKYASVSTENSRGA